MRNLLVRCVSSVNCMYTLHAIPNSLLTVTAEFRVCVLPLFFLLDQAQMHSKVKTSCIRWWLLSVLSGTGPTDRSRNWETLRQTSLLNLREYRPGYFHRGYCSLIWYVVVSCCRYSHSCSNYLNVPCLFSHIWHYLLVFLPVIIMAIAYKRCTKIHH